MMTITRNMYTPICLLLILFLGCDSHIWAQDREPISTEEVAALLNINFKYPSKEGNTKLRKLTELGPRAHPGLIEILRTDTYPLRIGYIVMIFTDQRPTPATRQAVRSLLERKGLDSGSIRAVGVHGLGKLGDSSDVARILAVLNDSSDRVRVAATKALGNLGTEATIPKIEAVLKKRVKGLTAAQIEDDGVFWFGYQAIGRIKYRMLLEEALKKIKAKK